MIREDDASGPRRALHTAIIEYLDEQYSPAWQGDPSLLPSGLRLQMHPLTRYRLLGDPEQRFGDPEPNVFDKIKLPIKINLDLKPGEWRLVQVTVEVKTGGFLP